MLSMKSEREQISKIRARHGTRNDETFSAIAGRTDEREACELGSGQSLKADGELERECSGHKQHLDLNSHELGSRDGRREERSRSPSLVNSRRRPATIERIRHSALTYPMLRSGADL